jgi:hypothetical protein
VRSQIPALTNIIEAIERIRAVLANTTLGAFEKDWRGRWLVERGVEIVFGGEPPP